MQMSKRSTKHIAFNANDRLTLDRRHHRYLDKFKDGILVESDDEGPRTVIALTWSDLEQRLHSRRLVVHKGYYDSRTKASVGKTFSKEQIAYFEEFGRLVLGHLRPTVQAAYNAMEADHNQRAELGVATIELCSLSTFCRLVNAMRSTQPVELPIPSLTQSFTKNPEVRPMDILEMDRHKIDVARVGKILGLWSRMHPDIQTRLDQLRYAWTSVAMDACTRSLCALHLTVEEPDEEGAIATLAMAVRTRGEENACVKGHAVWPQSGRPGGVHVDGAMPYQSAAFVKAVLGLTGKHPIPETKHANLRGRVERMFRAWTFGYFGSLPDVVGGNILLVENYDPAKHSHLTDNELLNLFALLIVERYHNIPQRALDGQTPLECWLQLSYEGEGVPPPPSKEEHRDLFGIKLRRHVTARGISIVGIEYRSDHFEGLHKSHHRVEVDVSVDETDISVISFLDPRDGCWHDAFSELEGLDNIALSEWMETIRFVTSLHDQRANAKRKIVAAALNDLKGRTATL
jgi:putative transposase